MDRDVRKSWKKNLRQEKRSSVSNTLKAQNKPEQKSRYQLLFLLQKSKRHRPIVLIVLM